MYSRFFPARSFPVEGFLSSPGFKMQVLLCKGGGDGVGYAVVVIWIM